MKFRYNMDLTIEAESLESAEEYMKKHFGDQRYKMESPLTEQGYTMPYLLQDFENGFKRVYYEPLCPYGCSHCVCDPAIPFAQKTEKSVITKADYPKDISCKYDEEDKHGDCINYDDEDK